MGVKLSTLEEGTPITLLISNADNSMQWTGSIKRRIKDNLSLIDIDYETTKKLNFDNVQIDLECAQEDDVPIIWHNVKIVYLQSEYVVQTPEDGVRHNRRNYFRVGVSVPARIRMPGKTTSVMIRDVSLSGFSIADRSKELKLLPGEQLSIRLEDLGFSIDLIGRVVRVEEREDINVYGLEICNLCKDLSAYISVKQRRKKS